MKYIDLGKWMEETMIGNACDCIRKMQYFEGKKISVKGYGEGIILYVDYDITFPANYSITVKMDNGKEMYFANHAQINIIDR